jgi:DNA-binding Xre family transcriptional regulator
MKPRKENPVLSTDATALVVALQDSGLSLRDIENATAIDRGQLSRISHGQTCGEVTFRTLARLAIDRGLL